MRASTRSQTEEARARLEAWAALGEACRVATAEQITILPSGVWTVHTRAQIVRQSHVLGSDVLADLIESVRLAGDVRAFSDWVFAAVPGSLGPTIVGERAPRVPGDWMDVGAADALRAHVERDACGLIVCPPGATGASALAWLAQLYDAEQIVLVSSLPAPDDLGPRVLHAYPPDTEGARHRLARLLRRAPVVLWDGVDHPSDARAAFGHAGATRRWMTLAASDPVEGLEAFAGLRDGMPTRWLDVILALDHGPRLTHMLSRAGEGWREERQNGISCLELVEELFPSIAAQRTVAADWSGAPGIVPPKGRRGMASLRSTVADPIMEVDTAPSHAVSARAASSLQEIFEDSDAEVRVQHAPERETRPNEAVEPAQAQPHRDTEEDAPVSSLADLVEQLDQESSPSIPALSSLRDDSPPTQELAGADEEDGDEGQILDELVAEIASGPVDPYSLDPDEFLAPHEATIPSAGHESMLPPHVLADDPPDEVTNLIDVSSLREEDARTRADELRDSGEIDLESILAANRALDGMREPEQGDAVTSNVPSKEFESVLAKFGVDMDEAPSTPPSAPDGVEPALPHEPTSIVPLPGSEELSWGEDENTTTHSREGSIRVAAPPLDDDEFDLDEGAPPANDGAPSSSTSVRLSALSLKLKALRAQRRDQED
jgi:hypothetical protein